MLEMLKIYQANLRLIDKKLYLTLTLEKTSLLVAAIELANSDAALVLLREEYNPLCKRINDTIQAKPIEERGSPGSWKGSSEDEAAMKDLVARSEKENERYKAAREAYRVAKEGK